MRYSMYAAAAAAALLLHRSARSLAGAKLLLPIAQSLLLHLYLLRAALSYRRPNLG